MYDEAKTRIKALGVRDGPLAHFGASGVAGVTPPPLTLTPPLTHLANFFSIDALLPINCVFSMSLSTLSPYSSPAHPLSSVSFPPPTPDAARLSQDFLFAHPPISPICRTPLFSYLTFHSGGLCDLLDAGGCGQDASDGAGGWREDRTERHVQWSARLLYEDAKGDSKPEKRAKEGSRTDTRAQSSHEPHTLIVPISSHTSRLILTIYYKHITDISHTNTHMPILPVCHTPFCLYIFCPYITDMSSVCVARDISLQ